MPDITPVVSIIMPAFNASRFIQESINSVIAQTFCSWELIVIDDNSVDETNSIVKEVCVKDPRIILIKNLENLGPAKSRNAGIRISRGRYIAFLDSDDLWVPEKLECQLKVMSRTGAALCFSAYKKINALGEISQAQVNVPVSISYETLLKSNQIGCLTAIFDTNFFGRAEMPEINRREDYGMWLNLLRNFGHEDYGFWLNILRNNSESASIPVIGVNKPLAYYRYYSDSLSGNKIKAAIYQWMIYRKVECLPLSRSIYYFLHYAYYGYKKYRIK